MCMKYFYICIYFAYAIRASQSNFAQSQNRLLLANDEKVIPQEIQENLLQKTQEEANAQEFFNSEIQKLVFLQQKISSNVTLLRGFYEELDPTLQEIIQKKSILQEFVQNEPIESVYALTGSIEQLQEYITYQKDKLLVQKLALNTLIQNLKKVKAKQTETRESIEFAFQMYNNRTQVIDYQISILDKLDNHYTHAHDVVLNFLDFKRYNNSFIQQEKMQDLKNQIDKCTAALKSLEGKKANVYSYYQGEVIQQAKLAYGTNKDYYGSSNSDEDNKIIYIIIGSAVLCLILVVLFLAWCLKPKKSKDNVFLLGQRKKGDSERLKPQGEDSERLKPKGEDSERLVLQNGDSERVQPQGADSERLISQKENSQRLLPQKVVNIKINTSSSDKTDLDVTPNCLDVTPS